MKSGAVAWLAALFVMMVSALPARADLVGLGGKCLDLRDKRAAAAGLLVLNTCTNGASQEWTLVDGKVVGPAGLCLDVKAGDRTDQAVVAPCNGGEAQRWTLTKGRLEVTGGKCLEARGDAETDGIPVLVDRCSDAAGQRWTTESME